MKTKSLDVSLPTDREIVMTREFAAVREVVFRAFTEPELVQRWLLGPPGWAMPVCEIDLRVGGAFRYTWRHPDKGEMTSSGRFREVEPPGRLVHTERFDLSGLEGEKHGGEGSMGDESVVTTVFTERGALTTVTMSCLYSSREVRDAVLATGMADGVEASYSRLEEILAELD